MPIVPSETSLLRQLRSRAFAAKHTRRQLAPRNDSSITLRFENSVGPDDNPIRRNFLSAANCKLPRARHGGEREE